ncbi:hypothetical protein HMPREF0208_00849 [Citrobacter koseri]|nr:hypothetical protein HMPREF0208_00849 [Citrobacter koseri]
MLRSAIGHLLRGICRMATLTRLIRPTKALCHRTDKRSAIRQYREPKRYESKNPPKRVFT